MAQNKFREARIRAEILEELYDFVESKERDLHYTWKVIGKEDIQAVDWSTKEPLWEDEEHTIPKYRDKYGEVTKTQDEMTEDDRTKVLVYLDLLKTLEKLL